jgi:Protein of unknown function (DUF3224)
MSTHGTGNFEGKSWDEKPYSEVEGGQKLTHTHITNAFHGDIEGEGTLEYLMVYHADGSATYFGLERVVGRIGNRSGSFVLQHSGIYEDGAARTQWLVVPGSGTGDLRSLRGDGGFIARHGQPQTAYTLDYDLE